MVCFSNHFRFNEYQGILRNMHFKRWSIMYFNYHSNRKEVYVANSSPLFETLNAVYSPALYTLSRLESHSGYLSHSAIIKLDNSQQISYYVYFYTIYSQGAILMGTYHNKNVMPIIYQHRVSYNLATAEFPRIKLKSEIVYNITIFILYYNFADTCPPKTFLPSQACDLKFHQALSDTV